MTSYDIKTGASFVRNDGWWGGKTKLDKVEWTFFRGPPAAGRGGAVRPAGRDRAVLGAGRRGPSEQPRHQRHRLQVGGAQADLDALRQGPVHRQERAPGSGLQPRPRRRWWTSLFKGNADIGNDSPFAPVYPYTDTSVPQRTRDVEKAKSLLAPARRSRSTLHAVKLQEVPAPGGADQEQRRRGRLNLNVSVEDTSHVLRQELVPDRAGRSAVLGCWRAGHRRLRPSRPPRRVPERVAQPGRRLELGAVQQHAVRRPVQELPSAVGVDAQTAAAGEIEKLLLEDSPTLFPYFFNYLSAHSKKFAGIGVTAIGHMFLGKAGQV